MNQLANSIAAAVIDAGANILAYPGEAKWGEEIEICNRRFKLNQHFYISYVLRDTDEDEYLNYVMPGQESLIRLARRIIQGGVVCACVTGDNLAGELGFLADDYSAGFCQPLKFCGLRDENLLEKIIALDDIPYMVVESYKGDGHLNVLLDRPLEQGVTHTSALTGGRLDAHKLSWGVWDGGLYVVAPKFSAANIPGNTTLIERHGINVRETRAYDEFKGGTIVVLDFLMGLHIDPSKCWIKR